MPGPWNHDVDATRNISYPADYNWENIIIIVIVIMTKGWIVKIGSIKARDFYF